MSTHEINIVLLNHRWGERHLEIINDAAPAARVLSCKDSEAADCLNDCDILVYWSQEPIDDLISNAPRLKWIHCLGAGVESIDFKKLQSSDIVVTNSKGIGSIPVAEHFLAMMLAFTRSIHTYTRQQKEHIWKGSPDAGEIYEKTLGIIGLGAIGREIAKKAKALGMRILAVNRRQTNELFVDKMYSSDPGSILEVCAKSDFVVLCLPHIPETRGLINISHFNAMKRSAYFFNIARGAIVQEQDLITALETNLIKGAGLDVFETEPLPADSPLWDMPNVIITPHKASATPVYMDRAVKVFADNLTRFLEGMQMLNVIDKTKGY